VIRRFARWLLRLELREAESIGRLDGYLDGFEEGVAYGREWPDPFPTAPRIPLER
jgi:hypothetical protein